MSVVIIGISGEILPPGQPPRTLSLNVAGWQPTHRRISPPRTIISAPASFGGYLYMGGNLDNPGDTALAADAVRSDRAAGGRHPVIPLDLPFLRRHRYWAILPVPPTLCVAQPRARLRPHIGLGQAYRLQELPIPQYAEQLRRTRSPHQPRIDPADYLWFTPCVIQTGTYSGLSLRFYGCSVEYTIDSLLMTLVQEVAPIPINS